MESASQNISNPSVKNDVLPSITYAPIYIGTYAKSTSNGIYVYTLNKNTGELVFVNSSKAGENPSYLIVDHERAHLYAANEEENGGKVSSFLIDASNGSLALLNEQPSPGGPCHVSIDQTNRFLFSANYPGGSIGVFPIQDDGKLGYPSDVKQHHGSSINKDRQEGPHCHFITSDPTNKFVFVIDLGLDQIVSYNLNPEKGMLTLSNPAAAFKCKPGAGPRHLIFHPNEKYAYLINELDCTVLALAYDGSKGEFTELQTISTLPDNFKGENTCAAIKLLPNGKFLYASNRGHDSIVVYALDESTGKVKYVQHVSTGGHGPRDFSIDLSGQFLVVANQKSNNVVVLKINSETGELTKTEHKAEIPQPVCVHIIKDFC